jgi:hypothetical protein
MFVKELERIMLLMNKVNLMIVYLKWVIRIIKVKTTRKKFKSSCMKKILRLETVIIRRELMTYKMKLIS